MEMDGGQHDWPPPDEVELSTYYAIYMEPDLQGGYQLFWALPPRFYYVFDLGWPVRVGGWFYYELYERTDGFLVGDPNFPTCESNKCDVASFQLEGDLFESFVPGDLLIKFRDYVDKDLAIETVLRVLPDSQIDDSLWELRYLLV